MVAKKRDKRALWLNMRRLHKDQRGFSLIELLVVVVLTGLVTAAITTTFFQVFNMNARTANHMSAISQVQQAGKLVSEDILESQVIDDNPAGGEFLIVSWNSTLTHEITYTLENCELWRSESIDGGGPILTRVAEYIDSDPTETYCEWNGNVLIFKVTATVGQGTAHEESEQRIYRVQPRPGT
jgi:prepilin-type N-terminal cleavage/methylation domain-containing protein